MTSRFLLTVLALLTGLSVQGATVEARDLSAQRAVIGVASSVAQARQDSLAATLPQTASRAGGADESAMPPQYDLRSDGQTSPVLIRVDRAHE